MGSGEMADDVDEGADSILFSVFLCCSIALEDLEMKDFTWSLGDIWDVSWGLWGGWM